MKRKEHIEGVIEIWVTLFVFLAIWYFTGSVTLSILGTVILIYLYILITM